MPKISSRFDGTQCRNTGFTPNSQTTARFIVVVIIIARVDLDFREGRKEATRVNRITGRMSRALISNNIKRKARAKLKWNQDKAARVNDALRSAGYPANITSACSPGALLFVSIRLCVKRSRLA